MFTADIIVLFMFPFTLLHENDNNPGWTDISVSPAIFLDKESKEKFHY